MLSGQKAKLPYSLSRWTDLPAAKWAWFEQQLDQGWMAAFDPRTALPGKWSLAPEDTFGMIFWTRDARNLNKAAAKLDRFPLVVHFTLTGWSEVELRAPDLDRGVAILRETVETFGYERVVWRFSPVPVVPDVLERFEKIAKQAADMGLKEVFLSFLQENDRLPETRPARVRGELLKQFAVRASGLQVRLCNEDRSINLASKGPGNLSRGVCESGKRFATSAYGIDTPEPEGCGCSLAVDPFTINESCTMGCAYCYAADKETSPKKRNTTSPRRLRVVS